jgi:hypothetical protein
MYVNKVSRALPAFLQAHRESKEGSTARWCARYPTRLRICGIRIVLMPMAQ